MIRGAGLALCALLLALPVSAAELTGRYIEARTCDVWTGPCFANAEVNLTGKHAVLGWLIEKGERGGVALEGLGVAAVVAATDTLGTKQCGAGKAVILVDERANAAQREALVKLVREQAGDLVGTVVAVEKADFALDVCPCKEGGCATLKAGPARVETRCLDHKHDKVCGNESAFFPPLSRDVKVEAAVAVEHSFAGKGVGATWSEGGRRSAYLGTFSIK